MHSGGIFYGKSKIISRTFVLGLCSFLSQISLVAAMAAINNMVRKYGAMDVVFGQREYAQIPMAVAIITPPEGTENDSVYNSKHFHEKLGYKLASEIKYCGYKFNRWYNTIAIDKILNNPSIDMKKFDEVRERFGL